MTEPEKGGNWRRLAAIAIVLLVVGALYWPAWQTIFIAWQDVDRATYSHGFLVLAISAWFLWRDRQALTQPDPFAYSATQRLLALAVILGLSLVWQFAYRAGIQLAIQMLVPVLLWVAVLALFGRHAARASLFPLAYLYFALPLWDALNPLAVELTTRVVQVMLLIAGVPAHFEGNLVQVPAGLFEIEGGCSGLHYLIVALSLGAFLGELRGDRAAVRIRWLVIAGALGLVVNWLRVFIVIVAGHLTQMQHYLVRDSHYGFGWALFAIVVLTLYWLDRRTPQPPEKPPAVAAVSTSRVSPSWTVAVVAALALPLALNIALARRQAPAAASPWPADVAVQACSVGGDASAWQPRQVGADGETRARYQCGEAAIETYVAWYREQHPGKELGGYDNRLQGDARITGWDVLRVGRRQFALLQMEQDRRHSVMLVAYRIGGREFSSASRAQAWYSLETFRTLKSPLSAAVAARAGCEPDCGAARASLTRFITDGGLP